jgi:hypothetical protein
MDNTLDCAIECPLAVKPRPLEHDDIEYVAAADGALWCSDEQGCLILRLGRGNQHGQ